MPLNLRHLALTPMTMVETCLMKTELHHVRCMHGEANLDHVHVDAANTLFLPLG